MRTASTFPPAVPPPRARRARPGARGRAAGAAFRDDRRPHRLPRSRAGRPILHHRPQASRRARRAGDAVHPGRGGRATERLRLVTSVLVLPYRNPVLTAKMVASLDVLSGGRVTLGVAVGWLKEEFEALDSPDFAQRAPSPTNGSRSSSSYGRSRRPASAASSTATRHSRRALPAARSRIRRYGSAAIPGQRCTAPRAMATAGIRSAPSPPRRCRRRRMQAHLATLKQMTEAEGRDFSASPSPTRRRFTTPASPTATARAAASPAARTRSPATSDRSRHRRARADLRLSRPVRRRQRRASAALRRRGDALVTD